MSGAATLPALPSRGRALLAASGPGIMVAVGYMDPGNWATDLEAGSRYGFGLLWVVAGCGLAAMLLQSLAMRLGVVAGQDLAQVSRDRYPLPTRLALWLLAEAAIVACDVAEVLGGALAITLLFGLPLWAGVLLTGLDTLLVLGLRGRGLRQVEAVILALVTVIGLCFAAELLLHPPDPRALAAGLVPRPALLAEPHALYLAVGILGATVMPHNLYLHSSVIQARSRDRSEAGIARLLRFATADLVSALALATLVNGAILTLAAVSFHGAGHRAVAGIDEAYRLLTPLTGGGLAATLFAVALLASGQSSTFTGTIAGQVILEGFTGRRLPFWVRRLVTRGLALLPALAGVLWLGDGAVGRLLVLTQVVLSAQLPFALWPLIRATGDPAVMGRFATGRAARWAAWALFGLIVAANGWLLGRLLF